MLNVEFHCDSLMLFLYLFLLLIGDQLKRLKEKSCMDDH